MSEADLYLNSIDVCRYWPTGVDITCEDCMARLAAEEINIENYPFLKPGKIQAFKLVLEAKTYLPAVPLLTVPQPIEKGLFPVNEPDENSLVIVTGNNRLTFEVLATVWSQGVTSAYFLVVDCLGNTVDMAMVYGDFTPQRLVQVLKESDLEDKVKHRHMIVPGLTASLADEFKTATNWEVEVGPLCAVELPLYLGERWASSSGQK